MLSYSDIKPKTVIVLDGVPFEVVSSRVFRKQQRKPVNQTKLKNMLTGKVVERSFQQSDTAVEADIEYTNAIYMFHKLNRQRGVEEYWFASEKDKSERFALTQDSIGNALPYLKENSTVELLRFDGEVIGLRVPVKMAFAVTNAPPNVKGNTAQGGTKPVTIETGATITTPMFVETGDTIEVNTETGDYVRRIE